MPTSARATQSRSRSISTRSGEIRRFDRVIANPPFSQNYTSKGMKFTERFTHFMPESGKKADLMFVQHMVASLKSDGRWPSSCRTASCSGVAKKEPAASDSSRTAFWKRSSACLRGLFYGTGIPACVLVINKHGCQQAASSVLFINADREYKEGKEPELAAARRHREDHAGLPHPTDGRQILPPRPGG